MMKPLRLIEHVMLISFPLLFGACTLTFGPGDGNGAPAGDKPSPLPAPKDPRGDEPALDTAQQARKAEAEAYVAEVIYKGATITQTIQLLSGDIVDGLDRATLPALRRCKKIKLSTSSRIYSSRVSVTHCIARLRGHVVSRSGRMFDVKRALSPFPHGAVVA